MSNVVEFPYGKISNPLATPLEFEKEVSHEVLKAIISVYAEYGYNVKDEEMFRDIAVLSNLVYATTRRASDMEHFLHEHMDSLADTFLRLKSEGN